MGSSGNYGPWDDYQQRGSGQRQYGEPETPPPYGQPQYTPWPQQPQPTYQQPGYGQQYPPPPPYPQGAQYAPPGQQPAGPPRRKRHRVRNTFLGLAALIVVIIVISVASGSGHSTQTSGTTAAAPVAKHAAAKPAKPAAKAAAKAPAAASAAPPASTKPAGTVSELEALLDAQNYLGDGQGFSRQGLIDQLDSSYGDSFSAADATWAVDHSDASWDDQAVDCAKGYMSDGQGFSRQGLIQQMTSAYGNKFTQAQAEYAANAVGL